MVSIMRIETEPIQEHDEIVICYKFESLITLVIAKKELYNDVNFPTSITPAV